MQDKSERAKQMLAEFQKKVEPVLEDIFNQELIKTQPFGQESIDYMQELRNLSMVGGKRLRGALAYYAYIMHHGNQYEEILKVSAALEIIHVFLLIEDDFMDLGKTRRGYTTIHEKYRQIHEQRGYKGDSVHFGYSIAVMIGLIADQLAEQVFNNAYFSSGLKQQANDYLHRQLIVTAHGQIHDTLNGSRADLTMQDIMNVLNWKSAVYTYENPLLVGAILAGASDAKLQNLSAYAIPAGIAFQIQDDILGSFGNEGQTGKPADLDIKEGKQTTLTRYAYEKSTDVQRKILSGVLGNVHAKDEEVEQVRQIMITTGALEYSKLQANNLVVQAKHVLEDLKNTDCDKTAIDFLDGIADYMINREL